MSARYLMDGPREADRLREKVDTPRWVEETLATWLARGARLLEVGTGPMHLLAAAAAHTDLRVAVGVDFSLPRLAASEHQDAQSTLAPVAADAQRLPFRDGVFDVSYTRFLLEYQPDPQKVVDEMVRATRTGGVVLLQDLDGQLVTHHPPSAELQHALELVLTGLAGRLDPYVGRKLFGLARTAGLTDIDVRIAPYHVIAGTAPPDVLDRWTRKLETAHPHVAAVLGPKAAEAVMQHFLRYLTDPDTLTFSLVFTVTGRVPPRRSGASGETQRAQLQLRRMLRRHTVHHL